MIEELINLKNKLIERKKEQVQLNDMTTVDLNTKVDDFIDWHFKTMIKGHYTDIGEFSMQNDMRNFIEKMAVWYELRYPDYEINRLMSGSSLIEINDVMFNSNKYINDLFDEDADIRALNWSDFYNPKVFISSLPVNEQNLFAKVKYQSKVYFDIPNSSACFHLTANGFVEEAEGIRFFTKNKIMDTELEGMHIKDVVNLFKEKGIELPKDNKLEREIGYFEKVKMKN